jgi:hypothetical protein
MNRMRPVKYRFGPRSEDNDDLAGGAIETGTHDAGAG